MPKAKPDGAARYARAVVEGKIISNLLTIQACQRHLDDLENAPARGFRYCEKTADKAADFFPLVLRLTSGDAEDEPFELLPWQDFFVRSVYGWLRADGTRRFRYAYLETAKGSGKTPLTAGMALRSICGDSEKRAEAYVIAKTKEQAAVAFREAEAMVKASDTLSNRLKIIGGQHPYRITDAETNSFLARVASAKKAKGHSGPMPHFVLVDEYHEHADASMFNFYKMGRKSRRQPLIVIPTNAGANMQSACGIEHTYAEKVIRGDCIDDEYFALIYSVDSDDEPMKDEASWPKANPSLPVVPGYDYIRGEVKRAEGMPSTASVVERLCFSQWVEAEDPWIELKAWKSCEVAELSPVADRKAAPCFLALDLSQKKDLTAGALVWDMGDHVEAEVTIWTPQHGLEARADRDGAPYAEWVKSGELVAIPGKTMDYDFVAHWIKEQNDAHELKWLIYDPWRMDEIVTALGKLDVETSRQRNAAGLQLVPHPQGFNAGPGSTVKDPEDKPDWKKDEEGDRLFMPRSLDYTEAEILDARLKVKRNRALRSAVLGTVIIQDASANRRANKNVATTRIDGCVALVMGVGGCIVHRLNVPTPTDPRTLVF